METNNKPLYKVLNEKRTQGELVVDSIFTVLSKQNGMFANCMTKNGKTKEDAANAQYTALAVNNLNHLAEALEAFVNDIEGHPSSAAIEHYKPLMDKAKEALKRIS